MPLDSTLYPLTRLRADGRRAPDIRRLSCQLSTQPASADGSSYFELGNTKVLCTVQGPREGRGTVSGVQVRDSRDAVVQCEVCVAGFAEGGPRRRRGGGRADKRALELQHTIANTFQAVLLTHLYPHSVVSLSIHVLAVDGSMLAACINAATLALIDAGIPMVGYVAAVTVGSIPCGGGGGNGKEVGEPILDVSAAEEQDGVPFLTMGCLGAPRGGMAGEDGGEGDKVVVLVCESRFGVEALEGMVAGGVEGCAVVRGLLDKAVRGSGGRVLRGER